MEFGLFKEFESEVIILDKEKEEKKIKLHYENLQN